MRLLVHTDASVRPRGRGLAFVARRLNGAGRLAPFLTMAMKAAGTDINELELEAIYQALARLPPHAHVEVCTDSQVALDQLGIVDRRLRHPRCSKLVDALHRIVRTRTGDTTFRKVAAHSGEEGNDLADGLARIAAAIDPPPPPVRPPVLLPGPLLLPALPPTLRSAV